MAYGNQETTVGRAVDGIKTVVKTALVGTGAVLVAPEVGEGIGDIISDFGATETGDAIVDYINGTPGGDAPGEGASWAKQAQQWLISQLKTVPEAVGGLFEADGNAAGGVNNTSAIMDHDAAIPGEVRNASLITGAAGADTLIGSAAQDNLVHLATADGGAAVGADAAAENIEESETGPLETITEGVSRASDAVAGGAETIYDAAKENPEIAAGAGAVALAGATYVKGRHDGYSKAEREVAGKFTAAERERQMAHMLGGQQGIVS